jgi:DNA-binding NarL/FixJ family response regulator
MTARVLVVDDEEHMRALIRTLFAVNASSIVLVGEASEGREAVEVWRELRKSGAPDVVVLDQRMPHTTGLDAAREILAERPDQIVVLFTAFLDAALEREALAAGVTACIDKRDAARLPELIMEVHRIVTEPPS